MRTFMRLVGGTAVALALLFLAALAGTFVPRPLSGDNSPLDGTRRILVLKNPIHTDIAIPLDQAVAARFGFLAGDGMPLTHPDVKWLIVGWGGRAFYLETPTWSDLKPIPVFKALTIDRSVMHVDIAGEIAEPHPAIAAFTIDEAGYDRLLAFIDRSFALEGGRPVLLAGAGYGPSDLFYEAEGYFNAIVGCNIWTAKALREAGLRTGWWGPLPINLLKSLSLFNDDRKAPSPARLDGVPVT